ncbi:MAG: nickel-responsive transcriptional regulator NikR [Gemmataceae bacterium]
MMSELTRITISLENRLLSVFDTFRSGRGYATRSEAIRDLIRDRLVRENSEGATGDQVAVVSLVYDHHERELAARLIDKQHHYHGLVVSTLHIHLGDRHCLEVSILRGSGEEIRSLGNELLATKGVLHGDIIFTGDEGSLSRWH